MALTDIQIVRYMVGDVPTNVLQLYPILEDDYYTYLLDTYGSKTEAAKYAAISVASQVAAFNTRERTGNIEVWNNVANSYIKVLGALITELKFQIPNGAMPYCAGISKSEVDKYNAGSDNIVSDLVRLTHKSQDEIYCLDWWSVCQTV